MCCFESLDAGSTHDKMLASWLQQLRQFLDNLSQNYVISGDPAYRGLHPSIVTTFTGHNLSPQHQRFNDSCTRMRQIVNQSINQEFLKWPK